MKLFLSIFCYTHKSMPRLTLREASSRSFIEQLMEQIETHNRTLGRALVIPRKRKNCRNPEIKDTRGTWPTQPFKHDLYGLTGT